MQKPLLFGFSALASRLLPALDFAGFPPSIRWSPQFFSHDAGREPMQTGCTGYGTRNHDRLNTTVEFDNDREQSANMPRRGRAIPGRLAPARRSFN
jgi:hypothetical protein